MTPAALDLLSLIAQKDIPSTRCELRPKNELIRGGHAVILRELTNTLSEKGGNSYVRPVLHITPEGRAYLETATK